MNEKNEFSKFTADHFSNDANSMLESPSSSVGSLDPASPRMRTGSEKNGGFYVTMTPLNSNSKVSVSFYIYPSDFPQ